MSASDEFPRGWEFGTGFVGSGNALSATIPASPGIIRILTDVHVKFYNTAAAVSSYTVVGGPSSVYLGMIFPPPNNGQDSMDWTGKIASALGGQMFVQVNNQLIPTGVIGFMQIAGYDI